MSDPRDPKLQLRERLRRLNSWRVQGPVPVEHNNEADYVIADDGSRWVMKRVAVTQAEQFLAEAISYQLGHLLRLPIPEGAYGGSAEGLAWFTAPARVPLRTTALGASL